MSINTIDIDFSRISLHGQSPEKSFEDLAFEFFRKDVEKKGDKVERFSDKGGDGGAEAMSKSGIALQAKYIFDGGKTQSLWPQLEKSICQAYRTYGNKLTQYHIYAPCNLRGQAYEHKKCGRTETTWEYHVKKWKKWFKEGIPAKKRKKSGNSTKFEWTPDTPGKNIEFFFHGEADLKTELLKPENFGITQYWFNTYDLSKERLVDKFKVAKAHIDVRYSEAHNVETSLKESLFGFCIPEIYLQKAEQQYKAICNRLQALCRNIHITGIPNTFSDAPIEIGAPTKNLSNLSKAIQQAHDLINDYIYNAENNEESNPYKKLEKQHLITEAEELISLLTEFESLLYRYKDTSFKLLLLDGEAGSGKTHLLASLCHTLLQKDIPVLFIPAGLLYSGSCIEEAIVKYCEFEGSFDTMLLYFDAMGATTSTNFILIIDAINEMPSPQNWKKLLGVLHSRLEKLNNVKIIFSCKSEFIDICIPQNIITQIESPWARKHQWINAQEREALLAKYFSIYNIFSADVHQYASLLRTPLEIKLFCETYSNKSLGNEYRGLITFLDNWLDHKCKSIGTTECIDMPARKVRKSILALGKKMLSKNSYYLDLDEADEIIAEFSPSKHDSDGLFRNLIAFGVLSKIPFPEGAVNVTFPYETISNYIVLLSDETFRKRIESDSAALSQANPSLLMLCNLMAAKQGREIFNNKRLQNESVQEAFFRGLILRGENDFSEESRKLALTHLSCSLITKRIEDIICCFLSSNHPLNADNFTEWLTSKTLPEQEVLWTIPLAKHHINNGNYDTVNTFLNIHDSTISSFSISKKELLAKSLLLFCKSNVLQIRISAISKLSNLIVDDFSTAAALFSFLLPHNDAYVFEGAYAAAAKASLVITDKKTLSIIAKSAVHFYKDKNLCNYVCRRYAEIIIERCILCKALNLKEKIDLNDSFHRNSPLYSPISARKVKSLEKQPEWRDILRSTRTEKDGWYGDFGRYTMTSAVHTFSKFKIGSKKSGDHEPYDCDKARRIILQIIKDLGINNQIYEHFDNNKLGLIKERNRDPKPIIRIGKKFQEIALNTFLASLDDHYKICDYYLGNRDFLDVRLIVQMHDYNDIFQNRKRNFPNCILRSDLKNILTSIQKKPDAFLRRINALDLDSIINSKFRDRGEECLILGGTLFKSRAWLPGLNGITSAFNIGIRCWLIQKSSAAQFFRDCKNAHFYGNGFCLPQIDGILPLYPQKDKLDFYASYENDWLSTQSGCPAKHTCLSLSAHNDTSSILVPSPIIVKLLELAWDGSKSVFVGKMAECRTYSLMDDHISALYVSKTAFLRELSKHDLIPVWAFWYEGYVYDHASHVHLYGGAVSEEGTYVLDAQLQPKLLYRRNCT